jgi:hypothetical protein
MHAHRTEIFTRLTGACGGPDKASSKGPAMLGCTGSVGWISGDAGKGKCAGSPRYREGDLRSCPFVRACCGSSICNGRIFSSATTETSSTSHHRSSFKMGKQILKIFWTEHRERTKKQTHYTDNLEGKNPCASFFPDRWREKNEFPTVVPRPDQPVRGGKEAERFSDGGAPPKNCPLDPFARLPKHTAVRRDTILPFVFLSCSQVGRSWSSQFIRSHVRRRTQCN